MNNKYVGFGSANIDKFIMSVGFGLTNVDTFIIRIGFGLMNINTIRILIRHEHDLSTRIATFTRN